MIYGGYDCVVDKPEMDDIFIAHYGVKGMKWRHRKAKVKTKVRKTNSNRENVKDLDMFQQFIKRYDEAKTDEEKASMASAAGNAAYRATKRPGWTLGKVTNKGGRLEEIYSKSMRMEDTPKKDPSRWTKKKK